jgi:CSLREA domain-containing protein
MLSHWFATATRRARRPSRRRCAPSLEALEGRLAPAAFTVNTLADETTADDVLSLREAISVVNSQNAAGLSAAELAQITGTLGDNDTVRFDPALSGGTIALTSGQLAISRKLDIDGPGADQLAVSGNDQFRAFSISGGATVTIAGLTIRDGRAVGAAGAPALGGGILNTSGTLTLDQDVLSDNQALGTAGAGPGANARGGAIANLSLAGIPAYLTVTDCLFTDNQALGGTVGQALGGGIDTTGGSLTVIHSSFIDNRAAGGFMDRRAVPSSGGGGIDLRPDSSGQGSFVTVSRSTFIGNQAIGGDGGFIDGSSAFQSAGGGTGGGIRTGGNSTVIVEDSTFTENLAIGGNGGKAGSNAQSYGISFGWGGGLFNFSGTATVSRCTFTDNQAIGGSGARGLYGRGHVGDGSGGGLMNVDGGTATATDCTFDHNEAHGGDGNEGGSGAFIVGWGLGGAISNGGLQFEGATLVASNLTITHNQAVGGEGNTGNVLAGAGAGGGLASWWASAAVTISYSTISHNQAVGGAGADGLGGGLANVLSSALTVSGCTVDDNLALGGDGADGGDGGDGLGGGVYNGAGLPNDVASSLQLFGSTVTGNHANGGEAGEGGSDGEGVGGGVYNLGSFDLDALTLIFKNYASTSDDDVFDPFA